MLDRLRRKLFLSVKLMGADSHASGDQDGPSLGEKELIEILRRGSSALDSSDDDMSFDAFMNANWETILDVSRKRQEVREAKMEKDVGGDVSSEGVADRLALAEEEERKLLSGVARVRTRIFEGKMIDRPSDSVVKGEWRQLVNGKREHTDRTVIINGHYGFITY